MKFSITSTVLALLATTVASHRNVAPLSRRHLRATARNIPQASPTADPPMIGDKEEDHWHMRNIPQASPTANRPMIGDKEEGDDEDEDGEAGGDDEDNDGEDGGDPEDSQDGGDDYESPIIPDEDGGDEGDEPREVIPDEDEDGQDESPPVGKELEWKGQGWNVPPSKPSLLEDDGKKLEWWRWDLEALTDKSAGKPPGKPVAQTSLGDDEAKFAASSVAL